MNYVYRIDEPFFLQEFCKFWRWEDELSSSWHGGNALSGLVVGQRPHANRTNVQIVEPVQTPRNEGAAVVIQRNLTHIRVTVVVILILVVYILFRIYIFLFAPVFVTYYVNFLPSFIIYATSLLASKHFVVFLERDMDDTMFAFFIDRD